MVTKKVLTSVRTLYENFSHFNRCFSSIYLQVTYVKIMFIKWMVSLLLGKGLFETGQVVGQYNCTSIGDCPRLSLFNNFDYMQVQANYLHSTYRILS